MKTAAGGMSDATHKDLVCGMYVDEAKARSAGNIATFDGKTFYFCMARCKDAFGKEPEKYIKESPAMNHAAMAGPKQSWLEMIEPAKGSHIVKKSGTFPGQKMKRTIGTPEGSSGVIDWDGPDKDGEKRDWTGWGKFPGAEYLGLKERGKKHEQGSAEPAAESESSSENAEEHSAPDPASASDGRNQAEMKKEMPAMPSAGDPAHHASP
jgi:YHS domain-containing protein